MTTGFGALPTVVTTVLASIEDPSARATPPRRHGRHAGVEPDLNAPFLEDPAGVGAELRSDLAEELARLWTSTTRGSEALRLA
jgi:hypothetical protein